MMYLFVYNTKRRERYPVYYPLVILDPDLSSSSSPLPAGIWSPGHKPGVLDSELKEQEYQERERKKSAVPETPVWSPTGHNTSPKKEFKPVKLDPNALKAAPKVVGTSSSCYLILI